MKQIYLKQAERSIRLQFPDYSDTKINLMAAAAYRSSCEKGKRKIKSTAFIENLNKQILIF